jgi:uncharacterized membrane protein YfcA
MKNKKLRLFPVILMLIAGSITSIMTYYFQYEIKTALLILLSVLLVFYLLGLLLVRTLISFDTANEEKRKAAELEEGLVLEKENQEDNTAEEDSAQKGSAEGSAQSPA